MRSGVGISKSAPTRKTPCRLQDGEKAPGFDARMATMT
jgi:hypothetical protein